MALQNRKEISEVFAASLCESLPIGLVEKNAWEHGCWAENITSFGVSHMIRDTVISAVWAAQLLEIFLQGHLLGQLRRE